MSRDTKLLREFIKNVLNEKIRSKTFDQEKFKTFKSQKEALQYAKENLKMIDEGSSRIVFELTSKRVLKVALNNAGVAQNEAEVDAFTDPRIKNIFARVFDSDKQFLWLVSELVRPIKDPNEWSKLTGVNYVDFKNSLPKLVDSNEDSLNEFTDAVVEATTKLNLLIGDVIKISSWGKTADGRAVLLDYGATEEIFSKHYTPKKVPTRDDAKTAKDKKTATASTALEPGDETKLFV